MGDYSGQKLCDDMYRERQIILQGIVSQMKAAERLREKLVEAFAGQPFLPQYGPASPRNQARFGAYIEMLERAHQQMHDAIQEWVLVCLHSGYWIALTENIASCTPAVQNGGRMEDKIDHKSERAKGNRKSKKRVAGRPEHRRRKKENKPKR